MITEPRAERLPYKGGFPVYPSRYVVAGGAERRAALRFFNASDVNVTGIRFRITEKDGEGNALAEQTVEREELFAESGKEFAVADVAVDYDCAAVEIAVLAVYSDDYEYIFEDGGVRLAYGHSAKKEENKVSFVPRPTYSVSKRRKRYFAIALFAAFGFAALAAALAWRFGFFEETRRTSAQADVSVARSVTDVEAQ